MVDADLLGGITPDYFTAIVKGMIPGAVADSRIGKNDAIPSSIFILLSNVTSASAPFVLPAAPIQMRVVSTSALDTGAGLGAQQVELTYLTSGFSKKQEIITLNGTTPVLTANTDIFRVDKFRVNRVGALALNQGTISLQNVAGTTTFERIDPSEMRNASATHWVPKGFRCIITDVEFGSTTAGGTIFSVFVQEIDTNNNSVTSGQLAFEVASGSLQKSFKTPLVTSDPIGTGVLVGISVKGRASNQVATGSFRFVDEPI